MPETSDASWQVMPVAVNVGCCNSGCSPFRQNNEPYIYSCNYTAKPLNSAAVIITQQRYYTAEQTNHTAELAQGYQTAELLNNTAGAMQRQP